MIVDLLSELMMGLLLFQYYVLIMDMGLILQYYSVT